MNEIKKTLNDCLQNLKNSLHFNQIEAGPLTTPLTIGFYESWLQQNFYGTMEYLKDHLELKKTPRLINDQLRSVISLSQSYFPVVQPTTQTNPARVALYAQNQDYHHWLKEKLNQVITELKLLFPNETFLPYVDSGPVLERNWAYQNQLGWFGKNTCLIHPQHGSLFFIAEILTSLDLSTLDTPVEPLPDFCGTCQKCITICPTKALIAPKQLQADRCISYLTIEAKEPAAVELRPLMQDWFFGCDLCQTICPWNEKVFRQKNIPRQHDTSTLALLNLTPLQTQELIDYFTWLLTSSHNQILKKLKGTPLARAGAKGLKRNALIVIANRKIIALKKTIIEMEIPRELEELKSWTLSQLT
jgi:epoxyqueuosine reductase